MGPTEANGRGGPPAKGATALRTGAALPKGAFLQMGLALLGMGISAYLTFTHYRGLEPFCLGERGCAVVQASPYAVLLGIPVALWGLLLYSCLALLSLAEAIRPQAQLPARLGSMALAGGGALYSAYLTWVEVAIVRAICWWCVASAGVVALLALTAGVRAWRAAVGPALD